MDLKINTFLKFSYIYKIIMKKCVKLNLNYTLLSLVFICPSPLHCRPFFIRFSTVIRE